MSKPGPTDARLTTWRSRLATAADAERGLERVDPGCQETLHGQLQRLMLSARKLVIDPRLASPGLRPARLLLDESLQLMRLAVEELRSSGAEGPSLVQFELLQELTLEVEELLQDATNQRRLVERLSVDAELLHRILEDLRGTGSPRSSLIWELADRVASQAQRTEDVRAWLRLPGVSLVEVLPRAAWPLAWFYAEAMESARWAALAMRDARELRADERRLVLSGLLLRDLGWLRLIPTGRRLDEPQIEHDLRRRAMRHPGAAAALVAGIADIPRRLPLIIGQHHERLDGTGYPAGTPGHLLCPVSRWVLTTTRFQEILTARFRQADVSQDEALQQIGAEFWQEVSRGRLDQSVAKRLLESLQSGLTLRAAAADGRQAEIDGAHRLSGPHTTRPLPLPPKGPTTEAGNVSVRPPMFLRKQRDGKEFHVPLAPSLQRRLAQSAGQTETGAKSRRTGK